MKTGRTLSVFTLAMINVAAIGTLKNWPVSAEYGFASVFFYLIAALVFFLPASLISAELATAWPKAGGIFAWVKEAFGHRTGFLAIWVLWVENVFWYPTILSFIAASIAYIINPDLASNRLYTAITVLVLFWATTLLNLRGMKTSGWISSWGVILGTFIPGTVIIAMGIYWFASGQPLHISFSLDTLIPDMSNPHQMVLFTGIMLSLAGIEMSAIHARDVKNPQRDYPRAILIAALIILASTILGVLSIAMVIPQGQISLVAGSLQAFNYFMEAYGLTALTPIIAFLITLGAIGSMSTWTVGPTKGLLAAARDGDLPPFFRRVNSQGMPLNLLIVQAIIVSILSLVFIAAPTVNIAFWTLTAVTAQIYLIMYILMFAAVIKLRYKHPKTARPYKVPGGKIGIWFFSGLGICSALYAYIICFFPPSQLSTTTSFYFTILVVCNVIACLAPSIILLFKKPSWEIRMSHETGE